MLIFYFLERASIVTACFSFIRFLVVLFLVFVAGGLLGGGGPVIVITVFAPAGPLVPPVTGQRSITPCGGVIVSFKIGGKAAPWSAGPIVEILLIWNWYSIMVYY